MPIVYQGVAATSGGGGDLFQGKKYWISRHCPNATTWRQHVQNNGGETVNLERSADIMIADHLKPPKAPVGSYSYKFIEESVEKGALQNLEDYLIHRSQTATQGSKSNAKSTRTPFSTADNNLMFQWVAAHEKIGKPIFGNEIWQALAERNSRHTWQSWRDHWVKKFQHSSRPRGLEELILDTHPSGQISQRAVQDQRPGGRRDVEVLPSSPRVQRPPNPNSPSKRVKFTAEDDRILIDKIRWGLQEVKKTDKYEYTPRGMKLYRDLAAELPHHSAHSWRDRWVKQLEPKHAVELEDLGDGGTRPSPGTHVSSRSHISSGSPTRVHRSPGPTTPHQDIDENTTEVENEEESAGIVPDSAPRPSSSGSDKSNASTSKRSARTRLFKDGHSDSKETPRSKRSEMILSTPQAGEQSNAAAETNSLDERSDEESDEDSFWDNYRVMVEEDLHQRGQCLPDDWRYLEIGNQAISAWDLWSIVMMQKAVPEERDWQQIAETLGFDWTADPSISEAVRDSFEVHLADFERIMAEMLVDDGQTADEETDQPERDILPSSPALPVTDGRGAKRRLEEICPPSDHTYPQSSPKRRRLGRNDEIPSTPDEKYDTIHLRHGSPTRTGADEDEALDRVPEVLAFGHHSKHNLEPETQDFQFEADTQAPHYRAEPQEAFETQYTITPSQQLLQELDEQSPEDRDLSAEAQRNPEYATPTPRRTKGSPIVADEGDEDEASATPIPKIQAGNPVRLQPTGTAKRRSLPKTFPQRSSRASLSESPPRQSGSPSSRQGTTTSAAPPKKLLQDYITRCTEEIDRFMSMRYPWDIVMRAMDATTWRPGIAGHVMEGLRNGEGIPANARSVWTTKDDDGLRLILSPEAPQNEKEARKRAKKLQRLVEKHTEEEIDIRKDYLEIRVAVLTALGYKV